MDQSKRFVLFLILIIIAGTAAWSWVNIYEKPDYDPEQAHHFLERFYMRCQAAHGEAICDPVVGDFHRQCFQDHLEFVPAEQADEAGSVRYDFERYLDCMNEGVDEQLPVAEP